MTGADEAPARIFLVGFMGSGKTTVGRLLANAMRYTFIDLDQRIEARAGESIPAIFERWGEEHFRDHESVVLDEVVREPRAVVATGGGTVIAARNRQLLARTGRAFWLNPSFDTLAARVAADDAERPLFVNSAQARQLYDRRLRDYEACGSRVDVAPDETPQTTANRVAELIRSCAT